MEGKLTKYFKYRKINKYLKSKNINQYAYLDYIFKFYVDGHLKTLLEGFAFSMIKCYSQIKVNANYLQIDFWYLNLHTNIEFDDDCFDYIVYMPGISADEFGKSIVTNNYSDDFNIENFFESFYNMLQKDSRLKK